MTKGELAELEMHLAAGTDLPTALAVLPREAKPVTRRDPWWQFGLVLGTVGGLLYYLWSLCA